MQTTFAAEHFRETIGDTLARLGSKAFSKLEFPALLEERFEADSSKARSRRMWREGLVAILLFNFCLAMDFAFVRDTAWVTTVVRTAIITPLAIAVNMLMLRNPGRRLREGSVAAAVMAIAVINLAVQGNVNATSTLFGTICLLMTALFAGVVMRLRFHYAAASLAVMLIAGTWYLVHACCMNLSERTLSASLMVIGLGIISMASYSMEREERLAYLLCLQRDQQATDLAGANAELKRISTLDRLTGLANRRAFDERYETVWAECQKNAQPLSAVMIDIDHFKRINDLHGHLYGDEALRRIGGLLPQALRGAVDMSARFGGEEFVILLPNADANVAITVAERVRQLVEHAGTPIPAGNNAETTMWMTVSCGVASCVPSAAMMPARLIDVADQALYDAKRGGRNRVEFRDTLAMVPMMVTEHRSSALRARAS